MTNPNRTKKTTRINANGDVVRISDDDDNDPTATSSAILRSGVITLDVFGFNLQLRECLVVLGILSFMFGIRGSEYPKFSWIMISNFYHTLAIHDLLNTNGRARRQRH